MLEEKIIYCIVERFGGREVCQIGGLSVIQRTKTIQSSTHY